MASISPLGVASPLYFGYKDKQFSRHLDAFIIFLSVFHLFSLFLYPQISDIDYQILNNMTYKETNLTGLFREYLCRCIEGDLELSTNNITLAFYSALNELDNTIDLAEVMVKFIHDFEYITKTIEYLARKTFKEWRYEQMKVEPYKKENHYYTIPEISTIYHISQAAIRRACVVGKLPYKEKKGMKCKYHISKADIEQYMSTSRVRK